jgi:DNA invertase Pin-like site-specific DNA recombinase/DNA-binding transcriptional MerR regulator
MSPRKPELISAVVYARRSTKGKRADGEERQEKSIPQQRTEVTKLADGRYKILKWFEDEGISGSRRGAQRPDFQKMLDEVKGLGAQAILCDNIDRFSRAAVADVQEDANALYKAGVRWIVTASHGTYDLGARYDIGAILKFVVAVWSACEYSRQLSRRITLKRRNEALEGKRTGGFAPYGLAMDGKHSLKHGDPKEIKIVRWLFGEIDRGRSMTSLAGDLCRRGVRAPRGGQWSVPTIRHMLKCRAYRGDFTFNDAHWGKFYGIDGKGEVVESEELKEPGKVFVKEGVYKPLVDPALFDRVQKRLEVLGKDRSQRKRMYALSGVLRCGHCDHAMYASRPNGKVVYKCSSIAQHGYDTCEVGGYQSIREEVILPFLMRMLGEEVKNIEAMLTAPPEELRQPRKQQRERREQAKRERETLTAQISRAEDNILLVEDARTRQALDRKLTEMRDHLEALDAELSGELPKAEHNREELKALTDWWEDFTAKAVSVPVSGDLHPTAVFWQAGRRGPCLPDEEPEEQAMMLDPMVVNQMLHALGAEVRLRWRVEKGTSGRKRYVLLGGRFKLGSKGGPIPKGVLAPSISERNDR